MNGSLTISRITRVDESATTTRPRRRRRRPGARAQSPKPAPPKAKDPTAQPTPDGLQFIQDNRENMNVRIDLGAVVPAKQPMTLAFEYEGALESPRAGRFRTRAWLTSATRAPIFSTPRDGSRFMNTSPTAPLMRSTSRFRKACSSPVTASSRSFPSP